MTISVRNAGVFAIATPSVKTGGVWQALTNGYSKVAGTWVEWYTAIIVALSDLYYSFTVAQVGARFQLSNTGSILISQSNGSLISAGSWITNPALVGDYECRATMQQGSVSSGTVGAWMSLSTTREWVRTAPLNSFQFCQFLLEIRNAATGAVVDSSVVQLECDRS